MLSLNLRRRLGVAVFLVVSLALAGLAANPPAPVEEHKPVVRDAPVLGRAPVEPVGVYPARSKQSVRVSATPAARTRGVVDLADPQKKEIAMRLVSSAENSTLDWTAQYGYIQDIGDGRGYTAGIVGFCSGTGDLKTVIERYTTAVPGNRLAGYLPTLRKVDGTDSHAGLDPDFTADWRAAAADPAMRRAQAAERDSRYFNPAVSQAKQDGLRPLGQFIYYDAIVMHGADGLAKLRRTAAAHAWPPAKGGAEAAYLEAFLDARIALMGTERAHRDTSRVDRAQRVFLHDGNLDLVPPLRWTVYGDTFEIYEAAQIGQ